MGAASSATRSTPQPRRACSPATSARAGSAPAPNSPTWITSGFEASSLPPFGSSSSSSFATRSSGVRSLRATAGRARSRSRSSSSYDLQLPRAVAVAFTVLIGVWSVFSIFPATQEIARAFLASSAVLAVIAGLALTTPLGNLGSGVLLAFTQPVRLGDRITIDEPPDRRRYLSELYGALDRRGSGRSSCRTRRWCPRHS